MSFESFFEEHRSKVFGGMCLVTANRQEAEEITQDAFLRVWERWDRVAHLDDLTGFLFKTAMNVFRNRARRASLAARRTLGVADRGDDLAAVEDRDEVIRVMHTLTPHQRAALVLTGYLGYSSEEAAQILGVRASTVRALATKGRAAARATGGAAMIDERERYERAFRQFQMPEPAWDRLVGRRDRKRRNQRIAAGVVGIAVFVAAVWIVTSGGWFDRSTPAVTGPPVPPAGRVGFIGLPPEGAVPSTPEHGELVLSMWGRSTTDTGHLFRAWLYWDGRLIWSKEGNFPYGANETTTGYLEQHLTPRGVEAMRAAIVSTGLFERDLRLISQERAIFGVIRAHHVGGFHTLRWANRGIYPRAQGTLATPDQERALGRIDELMRHPHTWLPLSSWEDHEIRAYVASGFAACYEPAERGVETSSILDALPAAAADLLRPTASRDSNCSRLTTDEARSLVQILDAAGIPRNEDERDVRVSYRFEPSVPLAPGPIENTVSLFLEPSLPHGAFPCSACG